ncbi:MAG: response regulator [Bacteroides sp.]|nr:response regulator [Bacteroides sp.]
MMRFKYFILTIFVLLYSSVRAIDKEYAFQQISPSNGLSYTVRCMVVSHEKGYVWVGTRTGIGRFDGYELKRYLRDNVTHIVEDDEHTVWAVTAKGLYRYDDMRDEFLPVHDSDNNPVMASSACLWDDGVLFGGRGMLYKYSYDDHTVRFYCTLSPHAKYNITNMQPWKGRLLCINRWNQTVLVDVEARQTSASVPFPSKDLMATLVDSEGNLWVAPYHQGVRCYAPDGKLLHSYHTGNSRLRTNVVLALAERKGEIWIGTDGGGISILNPKTGDMAVLEHTPGNPYSLPTNSILALYTDSNDNLWAGTVRSGLINIKEVGIKMYSDALPGTEYGLSEKSILCLYQGEDRYIWIGTDGGGINRFDPDAKTFHHVRSSWGDKIASIAGVDERHLLVSVFSKGLFFFDKQTETYRPLTIVNDSINALLCQQGKTVNLFRNTPETMLLLSDHPYLYRLKQKTFVPITASDGTEFTGTILPIYKDDTATYLYGLQSIYRMDAGSTKFRSIYTCLGDTVLNSVDVDEDGNFWVGSNYGLGCYSVKDGKYTHISNTLIDEVSVVVCDRHGQAWIGTNDRLLALIIRKGEFILYGETDGVIPNEYLAKPRLLSDWGDVYLGTFNGLLCIGNQLPEVHTEPLVIELGDVFVGNERMNASLSERNSLTVEEEGEPISVKLMVHDSDIFQKLMYRYTLHGMDGQVIYSYQPELTLSGLPAGVYQLLAACSTRTGGWTKDYPIVRFIALPPWYKSDWFIGCCILLVVAMFALCFFYLFRRKERKLKWEMKEHEQQVYEEKVRFLININHELRTPLTLIHAPLKQLLSSLSPTDGKYAVIQNIVRQSSRMKKLLNMVLDVRKMEVGYSVLDIENLELLPWLEQTVADFRPVASMQHITLDCQADSDISTLCCDKEKCTTILTNLLVNALKYSPENGQITVSAAFTYDKKRIRISVSDQGPGLKEIDINSLFTRFYQGNNARPGSGIGLSYSKILVEQQQGSIGAYDHGNRPGATFWFELPRNLQPGKVTLRPQAYLNELLAPTKEFETLPSEGTTSPESPTSEAVTPEATQAYTLLIVDDNKDLTDYLNTALQSRFKQVLTAFDGEEALRICHESCPDIVVSDVQMPRMSGYELCRQMKSDLEVSHIPIVLLTARNDEASQMFGYKSGADAYLTKPFEIDMLCSVIYSQLENRRRMRVRYSTREEELPLPQESTFSPVDEDFLCRLDKVINGHLSEPKLGVPLLCAEMGMSRASLYNKLKALTGMGANDYITKIRIEQATELLANTSLSINEIADRTGFSTARYFSTVFKQYRGCSPTQYKSER